METPSASPLLRPSAVNVRPDDKPLWDVTEKIIGAAIEVHRQLGPGFLEHAYEEALCLELEERRIAYQRQVAVSVKYKGVTVDRHRIDLIVDDKIVVEVKAVKEVDDAHLATVLAYLRATKKTAGLIVNFSEAKLRARRVVKSAQPGHTAEGRRSGDAEGLV